MQSVLKISNLNSENDINKIKSILSNIDGILGIQLKKEEKNIIVVYDNLYINLGEIRYILDEQGYLSI